MIIIIIILSHISHILEKILNVRRRNLILLLTIGIKKENYSIKNRLYFNFKSSINKYKNPF